MADHPLARIEAVVLVAVGGFAGSNLRFLVDGVLPGLAGTLLVNALGSFLLGALLYEAVYTGVLSGRTRIAVGTGLLSSFTTYSTFAVETVSHPGLAAANIAASYGLGFAGVLAGRALARRLGRAG